MGCGGGHRAFKFTIGVAFETAPAFRSCTLWYRPAARDSCGKERESIDHFGVSDLLHRHLLAAHSLPVVAQPATHIAVMRSGQFVECGPAERVLREPASVYACELLVAGPGIPRSTEM
jgi:hypothetical protein